MPGHAGKTRAPGCGCSKLCSSACCALGWGLRSFIHRSPQGAHHRASTILSSSLMGKGFTSKGTLYSSYNLLLAVLLNLQLYPIQLPLERPLADHVWHMEHRPLRRAGRKGHLGALAPRPGGHRIEPRGQRQDQEQERPCQTGYANHPEKTCAQESKRRLARVGRKCGCGRCPFCAAMLITAFPA